MSDEAWDLQRHLGAERFSILLNQKGPNCGDAISRNVCRGGMLLFVFLSGDYNGGRKGQDLVWPLEGAKTVFPSRHNMRGAVPQTQTFD